MSKKQRRSRNAAFKLQVVQMMREPGLSGVEFRRDMKFGETAVRRRQAQVDEAAAQRIHQLEGSAWQCAKQRAKQHEDADHAEAMTDNADDIMGFYNPQRLHTTLGNLPPNPSEQHSAIKQPIAMSEKTESAHARCANPFDLSTLINLSGLSSSQ